MGGLVGYLGDTEMTRKKGIADIRQNYNKSMLTLNQNLC